MVRLSDVAPEIAQVIRYAGSFNFTGAPVPGYAAPECILTRTTAEAMKRVDSALARQGFGLVVFDCYRPRRAVRHFVAWAGGATFGPDTSALFFPDLRRSHLIAAGYISSRSGHSFGHTVDVGLRRAGERVATPMPEPGQRCDAPLPDRWADTSLEMGTAFDCFSPLSAIGSRVSKQATANRALLADAMAAEGFSGYAAEWWHFRNSADAADEALDFVIR
jgi:D-alanyl-D-alanine dipeptidase